MWADEDSAEMRRKMENNIAVYVSVLQDSLRNKWEVLKEILELTQEQEKVLCAQKVHLEEFDRLVQEKGTLLERLDELDRGFEEIFGKVGTALKEQSGQYKPQILELQNYIRTITECSVKIQALEKKNKERFTAVIAQERREIRDFKVSNKTATSYYQNMANQHHEWQSYFVDKKK